MAVITKDAKITDSAPKVLLMDKHVEFIHKYGKDKEEYDYVMSEFLRINGIYWAITATDLMGEIEKLDKEEVRFYRFILTCTKYLLSIFNSRS